MATLAQRRGLQTVPALILLLGASLLLNYVDRGAIGVAAPLMKSDLGLSATAFGIAVSAFFWIYAPVQLVLGSLCDRWSVYRMLALGTALWSASTILMGFVGGFLSLFLLRMVLGVGESIIFPGSSKMICRHVPPERRGLANAVVMTGVALGPAVGTLLGGSILATFGWRAMFVVFGMASALWLIPWSGLVRTLPVPTGADRASFPLKKVIGRWSLWAMGVGHATSNYGLYFMLAFLPLFLVQQRGFTILQMTMLATLGYAVQAISALAFGAVSDRWARAGGSEPRIRRSMLVVGHLIYGVAILALFAVHSMPMIALLLCILGACGGPISVNIYAVAQMFAGERASGTWVGIQNAVGNVSGIFGPALSGFIIDRMGYGSAFALAAAISIAGGLWWAFVLPRIEEITLD
ncbi:MAG TPA: MFS transporter [Sphingomicrobium sp.]|nr:MFS transporter [Sphingomicrobium sp.]